MIISTPYYSQYLDVGDSFWKERTCAIACAKILIETAGGSAPGLDVMTMRGIELEAYDPRFGWIHDGLIRLAEEYGTTLTRKEWRTKEDEKALKENLNQEGIAFLIETLNTGRPLAISTIRTFTEQETFHMVVLVGYEEGIEGIGGFYYHDPDAHTREDGMNRFVDIQTFKNSWRCMAIFAP